jgi:ABC-type multidrug transport system fused ATPase/permease subunit
MFKKINYVLDRRQKRNLVILLFVILIGSFVELLGVSAILPVANLVTDPNIINEKWYYIKIGDMFGFTNARQMAAFFSVLLIVIYIFKNIYITIMYNFQYEFVFNNQKRLAVKMMECYMNQDYLFHVSKNVAELQRNVTSDVNGFFTVVLNAMEFIAEFTVCLFLCLFLFVQDAVTTFTVAGLIVVFGIFFTFVYKKVLVKKGEENRYLNAQTTKWILQSFSGIKEIKVANSEQFFVNNYNKNYSKFAVLQREQSMLKFIPRPIMESVCICGLLGAFAIKMQFSGAQMSSFVSTMAVFVVAAVRMLPSFNRITGNIGSMMFDKPAIDSVYHDLVEIEELMDKRKLTEEADAKIVLNDRLKVDGISFHYPESEEWVLNHANLVIEKNQSVAIIGASGAGKTTMVDIILGLLEPQEGKITVDGIDIWTHMESWHQSIGYIPQSIYLMDDTIRANIAFGVPESDINDDAIAEALVEAQLDQFVASLPEGLDTVIGDRGVKLSGGQRQRIGIARALYRNPEVLILDEATSALDNETEREVMAAIDGLHGQRTMIVIAHRLTTIRNCDAIYEVANGVITRKTYQEVFGDN